MIAKLLKRGSRQGGEPDGASRDGVAAGEPAAGVARRHRRVTISAALALAVVAAAGSAAYLLTRQSSAASQELRPAGTPAGMSTRLANLMHLDMLPRPQAPGFTLTDQAGRRMSLSSFRGKVVVLEFMDPHCTDICPIVSQEFVDAYHDLGPTARNVVFAAVNVNQYYRSVHAVEAFSAAHQLTTIPSWHFFTGPAQALQAIWRGYNIYVHAPNPNADIIHTSAVYIIDARGRERFLLSPEVDHTKSGKSYLPASQIADWGHGIATLARNVAQ